MGFVTGARDAFNLVATRRVQASGALVPPPELASPWADSDALNTVVWSELLTGGDTDLLPLTRTEAMAIPAVARARNVVCTTLGRCPITAVDRNGRELQPTILAQPDPAQTRFVTLTWAIDDLVFYGVSWFLVLGRLADGRPHHVRRLQPGAVDPTPGPDGRVRVKWADGVHLYPVRDIIRVDGPHEGILNFASRSLRHARALEQSARRFSDNPVPAVELHQTAGPPLPKPERDQLIRDWADARAGKNGGVAYTSANLEARVHGAPAENLLTHGRNAAAIDCARNVGVPADVVDATPEHTSMTYANVETRGRVLIDYGLAAYAAAFEGRFSMDDILPAGTVVRWDLSSITTPSATQSPPEVST